MLKALVRLQAAPRVYRERGATAVEYGIMVALIAAVIVVLVSTLGGQIADAFQDVIDGLNGTTGATGTNDD